MQAQAEQLKILREAAEGTLPKNIVRGSNEFSFNILRELCDSGMITAAYIPAIRTEEQEFINPRITLSGRQHLAALEKLAVPDHASEPATNPSNNHKDWHEGFIGKIGVGLVIAVVGFLAVYLITHHLELH